MICGGESTTQLIAGFLAPDPGLTERLTVGAR
jgi:hypothetical protein